MRRIFIIATVVISSSILTGLLYFFFFATPIAVWYPSSDAKIISLSYSGEVDAGYISDVQLWGDGRIVWVEYDSDGNRQVFGGHLPKAEMKHLINQFIEIGFFDRDKFFDEIVFGPYVRIKLLNADYRAPVFDGALANEVMERNENLDSLARFLQSGAGAKKSEFIPSTGTLLVYKREETRWRDVETTTIHQWPGDKFGYGLETVHDNAKEIKGEELAFAWDIVNTPNQLVESQGKIYLIVVIVPKISY
ncbi:MAG: hypothetical protein GY951_13315 [Psychromonas sp.]|nr:hypothetical protein [Psychromonas sp.]